VTKGIHELTQERAAFIPEQARLAGRRQGRCVRATIGDTLRAQSKKHGIPMTEKGGNATSGRVWPNERHRAGGAAPPTQRDRMVAFQTFIRRTISN